MKTEGIDYKTGKAIEITLKEGIISKVKEVKKSQRHGIIGPGLTDLQINGFHEIDFNSPALTSEKVYKATVALIMSGTTSFFPTFVTNSEAHYEKLLLAFNDAIDRYPLIRESIPGFHLEGPFISSDDGARGAHHPDYIQEPDWDMIQRLQEKARGKIKIITLAPEVKGSIALIKKCVKEGIIVAIGHSNAQPSDIRAAADAGASMSTHLGNACPVALPRHPNMIWEQLADDRLAAGLIADGHHLPASFLKTAIRTKGKNCFLVSDSTMFAGMPPGEYESPIGGKVELDQNGRLFMKNQPELLAGASKSLYEGMVHLVQQNIASIKKSWELASVIPEKISGIKNKWLKEGSSANFIVLDKKTFELKEVIKNQARYLSYEQ